MVDLEDNFLDFLPKKVLIISLLDLSHASILIQILLLFRYADLK